MTDEKMNEAERAFAEWFCENYPSGVRISDPSWHAPKIFLRAIQAHAGDPLPKLRKSP